MTPPTASVIIVTMNRPAEIQRCLEAFHRDLADDCDVIVVDASYNEQTRAALESFPRVRYLHSSIPNMCVQRNQGFRASAKDIAVFIDDDAVPAPGWLATLLESYQTPNIYSVVGGVREEGQPVVPAGLAPVHTAFGLQQPIDNWQQPQAVDVPNGRGTNMSFRRDQLEMIGGFDEHYRGHCNGEDKDVFVRLRRHGGRILYQPAAVVTHYPGPTAGYTRSNTSRQFMFWMARNNAYGNGKLYLGRPEFIRYWLADTLLFFGAQLYRLFRGVLNGFGVIGAHLAGKFAGLVLGLGWHLRKQSRH